MKHIQVKTTRKAVWVQVPRGTSEKQVAIDYARKWKDTTVSVRDESGKILARALTTAPKRPRREVLTSWECKSAVRELAAIFNH